GRVEEDKPPVSPHHELTLRGERLRYAATAGMLPIKNEQSGVTEGQIFYVAYTKDGASAAARPLLFAFNGGPGSSTVWLHMGAYGPMRVHLLSDGAAPPPPHPYEENPVTPLHQTDLVFVHPVGPAYSPAARPADGAQV